MIQTEAEQVRVKHKLTKNQPVQSDLFIEVDDLKGNPVAAFSSPSQAGAWLYHQGYEYVAGSNGVWARSKKSTVGGGSLTLTPSMLTPSPQDRTLKKSLQRFLMRNAGEILTATVICLFLLAFILTMYHP
jgi:hypothetical protein